MSAERKEFEDAYMAAITHWSPFLVEAEKDLNMALGDQWDAAMKAYLKQRRREAYVFNKIHRIIKLITGFQRKNRLSLKFEALLGGDSQTASQFTKAVMWHMQYAGGYQEMSEAFEKGALITGINLVHLYVDRLTDPINGDIRFSRCPYNSFLLDPNIAKKDLSDCAYILRRKYLSKEQVKALLPWAEKDIELIKPGSGDNKFPQLKPASKNPYAYDEFWRMDTKKIWLATLPDGSFKQFENKKEIEQLFEMYPPLAEHIKIIPSWRKIIKLQVFVEGNLLYDGDSPWITDNYPFVPVWGFFTPEVKKPDLKIFGIVRVARDPQTEVNKRRSQMIDIIESTIAAGWKAKEGKLVDPNALYQSGQGLVVWLKETANMEDVQRLDPPQIPAGLFQLSEVFDKDVYENVGANAELLGSPENENIQIAALLSKLRQGSGLTILQDLFDSYRSSKKLLGMKLLQMIQENYTPNKVQQIIGEPPTQLFFSKDYAKYNCTPAEGILTDSQRQMYFGQLIALQQMGVPIPPSALLEAAPIQNKEELIQFVKAAEQAQAQQAQENKELEDIIKQVNVAKMQADLARAHERVSQEQENRANALLDRIKAIKELEKIDVEKFKMLADALHTMELAKEKREKIKKLLTTR